MTESKINDLLSKMNIEEKIGQLNQYFSFASHLPARHGTSSDLLQPKELRSPHQSKRCFQIPLRGFAQRTALPFWLWSHLRHI